LRSGIKTGLLQRLIQSDHWPTKDFSMEVFKNYTLPYKAAGKFQERVAYFSMEFGIDQALKIFSGGLGFLAGSHMRSAFALKQNLIGIGMLWKFGYYDQMRRAKGEMDVLFRERKYNFLQDTGIKFTVPINGHPVWVKAWYLAPDVFNSAPIFLLSTDLPENDYLAQTITHRLYDNNMEAKIAQCIILGQGGAKLLEAINWEPNIYHLNEAHALPAAFHLYGREKNLESLRSKLVLTTHTPVEAGNEKHDIGTLERLGFFGEVPMEEARRITGMTGQIFNQTLGALRLSGKANAVSKKHGDVAREMWGDYSGICEITHITNSQNHTYWKDEKLDKSAKKDDWKATQRRKKALKEQLFAVVADQTGKILDPDVLTVVWARRIAGYKRADLITRDLERFERLVHNTDRPIQIIWAGKPYPMDYQAIDTFNHLVHLTKNYGNCVVLTGYELALSKLLKAGSDVWLNNPRVPREASGTSGMTAAMNGSVNLSTWDGWIIEFVKHGDNGFVVPEHPAEMPYEHQDILDRDNLLYVLEEEILPLYYEQPEQWWNLVNKGIREVVPFFDSDRMATEYYQKLYHPVAVQAAELTV
jgi:starch phosphorylase